MVKLIFGYRQVSHSIEAKVPPEGKQRSGKERNFPIVIDGIQVSRVTIPKEKGGGRDMSEHTLKSIRDQLFLRTDQFIDFIKCPMTSTDYINAMKEKFPSTFNH